MAIHGLKRSGSKCRLRVLDFRDRKGRFLRNGCPNLEELLREDCLRPNHYFAETAGNAQEKMIKRYPLDTAVGYPEQAKAPGDPGFCPKERFTAQSFF